MARHRVVPLVVLLALGFAACSSSGSSKASPTDSTTSTTRTSTPTSGHLPDLAGVPQITDFTGPPSPVLCTAPTSVELHWKTPVTATVDLRINGGPVFATYPGGRGDHLVPLECDGRTQIYELTARGPDGTTATKTLKLAVSMPVS